MAVLIMVVEEFISMGWVVIMTVMVSPSLARSLVIMYTTFCGNAGNS